MQDSQRATTAPNLNRLFRPRSVAVVGASEQHQRSRAVITGLQQADVELFLINPNRPSIFGAPTFPSLAAVERPIDTVFVTVNSAAAIDAIASAAGADIGGLVVNAGGFAESGQDGVDRQERLMQVAGGRPLLGPNCNGFIDVRRGIRISGAPHLPIREGGLAFVTHSGALFASMGAAGYARQIGFSYLISTGNEATLDMADCIDFLVDDPGTKAICLAIETIRRPKAFFAAVARSHAYGKPVLALKLGRGERARAIATSHTGAVAGETWIYDAAFRQHGIEIAYDLTELADRAICFDQLPRARWSALDGLAILTASGGGAEMASDFCSRMNIPLSNVQDIGADVRRLVPGTSIANPLDMTGFVVGDAVRAQRLVDLYAGSTEVDTIVLQWFLDDAGVEHGSAILSALESLAGRTEKTLMLGSLEDTPPGRWAAGLAAKGVAVTHGLPSTLRALQSMGAFVKRSRRPAQDAAPITAAELPAPSRDELQDSSAGPMVKFGPAMRLLSRLGFEIAPYQVVQSTPAKAPPFDGPFVVKLADVPHRTDIGAVRLNVSGRDLGAAVREMQEKATELRLPRSVVIQKQVPLTGEAFMGVKGDANMGPVVVCGAGGILVELTQRIVGALAPLSVADVNWMLGELASLGVFRGIRGSAPWDRGRLAEVILATNRLAVGGAGWLDTIDINPLGLSEGRFVVVDALITTRKSPTFDVAMAK